MSDTLRSIVERMEHDRNYWDESSSKWICFPRCPKCRIERLLSEAECDLVKKWKQAANDMREGATRERAYAERFYDERAEHLRNATDFDDTANLYDARAAELETWLAMNLERIKAEARLEEAKFISEMACCCYVCVKERIAALEAQTKK